MIKNKVSKISKKQYDILIKYIGNNIINDCPAASENGEVCKLKIPCKKCRQIREHNIFLLGYLKVKYE